DVTEPEQWDAVVKGCDRLDRLVLNAGVRLGLPEPDAIAVEDYMRVMDVNLNGVFFGIRAAVPLLSASGGGSILVIGSMAAVGPLPRDPVYATTKHALVGLVRSLAPTLIDRGVRINMLCPGVVETGFLGSDGRRQLEARGVVVLDPAEVAVGALAILDQTETGQVFVQPGRAAPTPHEFPTVDRPGT
ncbi:MAG: short-chain dehydrogenase/reductase, partial [Ilumatobacteraceae bacterium]|nr:short-chain dehydrogenase/reductase [Ilumatobacteraceae bacterium]